MSMGPTPSRDDALATGQGFLTLLLWAHVPTLAIVGLALGAPLYEVGLTSLTLIALALGASTLSNRRLSAITVSLGLLVCSAIVSSHTVGSDLAHFHFFLVIAAISLCREWVPLVFGVVAIAAFHFVVAPQSSADPTTWALTHIGAITALALVLAAGWRHGASGGSVTADTGDRFRLSFEASPIGMAVLKPSGELIEVNKAMTKILGYDQASLIGANIAALIHVDDQAELGEAWEVMGNSVNHSATEWMRCVTAKGPPIWGRVSLSLVPRSSGQTAMVALQLEDVTHSYEEQKRLERLLKGKDDFVATLGDEIREPLGMLIDLTDIAEHPHVDSRETLPRIEAHAREIASILDDLVVSARAETTPVSVVAHHLDAERLCREVVGQIAGGEGVTLEFGSTQLWADAGLTRQIVHNLVSNALRYGGPNVTLRTVRSGPDTVIQVIDDGPEIPESERDRVFSGDLRNGHPVTSPAAVGLSLTVGRHLARLMDGDVEYRRSHEGSNVFELRLPSEQMSQMPRRGMGSRGASIRV